MAVFTGTLGYSLYETLAVRISATNEKGVSDVSPMSYEFATAKVTP
jgi:hypothetical protein